MRLLARAAATVFLVLAVAAPATAQTFEPNVPLTPVYLTCDGGRTKEWFVNASVGSQYATWSETPPASVTTGAGCGFADEPLGSGVRPRTPYDLTFSGTYTGNLRDLNVVLHLIGAGSSTIGDPLSLDVRMTIDGYSMFGVEENENVAGDVFTSPATRTVTVTPVPVGDTGAVLALPFSVTALDLLLEDDDVEHVVEFTISTSAATPNHNEWVWGAAEAPTGVTFNPDAVETARLKADKRTSRRVITE